MRTTKKDLREAEISLNEALDEANSKFYVGIGGRYGYQALDVYERITGKMLSTYRAGYTKKEVCELCEFATRILNALNKGENIP